MLPIVPTWVPGQKFLDCMGSCITQNYAVTYRSIGAYLTAGMPFMKTAREKELCGGGGDIFGSLQKLMHLFWQNVMMSV